MTYIYNNLTFLQEESDNMLKKQIVFLMLACLLTLLGTGSYADITAVVDRTPVVRDTIVAAISDVDNAADVTEAHLATITSLNLRGKSITTLQSGDFSGLTGLTSLNLYNNELSSLPDGIFEGLTALTTLRLGGNTVDPMPITVSLEKVGDGQFKAVVLTGAPFDVVLPISATNGSISDNTTSITIATGSTESSTLTITRTAATTAAVTTNIGTLPSLPANHYGYVLSTSDTLPLEVISELEDPPPVEETPSTPETDDSPTPNAAPIFTDGTITIRSIAENTVADVDIGTAVGATDTDEDTLTYTLSGTDMASFSIDSSSGQLKTKSALDYETKRIYTVTITVSDGSLTATISVIINVIDVAETTLTPITLSVSNRTPAVRDAIVSAVPSISTAENITATNLATITSLNLRNAGITHLKSGDFSDLTALTDLNLYGNMLSSLPDGIFAGLTSLTTLRLGGNVVDPLPLIVSVQQVSPGQFKAVIPTAAPFNANLSINGSTITISKGSIESATFMSSSIPSIDTLPTLPSNHYGYTLAKSKACNRTLAVRNGIVAALTGITDCQNVSDVHLAQITTLDLSGASITSLAAGDFDGMLSLTTLNLSDNQLSNLPDGTFASLSSLTTLNLSGNTVEPLPISVMLEKVGTNQIKVIVPSGAPFEMMLPINVMNGGITGGMNTAIISKNGYQSQLMTITRRPNSFNVVTVDFGTMPSLPINHTGYLLTKTNDIPLKIFDAINVAPIFTAGAVTTRSIAENSEPSTTIGQPVTATDANNDTLTYTLSGPDSIRFDIDSTTGQLNTKEALDYEIRTSYTVTITVSDGSLTDTIDVTINITDIDEVETDVVGEDDVEEDDTVVVQDDTPQNHAPEFTEGTTTTRSIPENTVSGTDIGNAVSATDADGDTLTYTLGGTDGSSFSIDSSSGQLRTEAALDFEKKDSYSITIFVSDGNDGKDLISVTISVTDLDEAPDNTDPVFSDGDSTSRSIAENTGSGVDIGNAVSATDVDNDTLTYNLSGTDAAAFSIDSTSGQLRTSSALDYETKNSYAVTVSVSDGNGGSDSISVTINITNIDETPTNSAPEFTEGVSTSRSIAENTGSGVDIGSAVSATDVNGDTLTYTLGGTDASSFSLDSSSGQLRTSVALDYETKTSYSVILTVSDENGASDSIRVTINVTDVDESPINNPPVFDSDNITTLSTPENTTSDTNIGSAITATDSDNNTLTYGLVGTDAASFDIVSTSGQLKTKAVLNHEAKDSYSVTLTVSDGQGGSDSIGVTINVLDVNESPSFSGERTTRSIAENTALNTNIGAAVVATDPDVNTTLTYTLDGTDAAVFSIDSKTGQLKTKDSLDFETKQTYSVTIVVSDGSLSDRITVTINIIDLDETPSNNPPVFTDGETTTRTVAENTATGTDIGDPIAATDADRNTLAYAMSGDDASAFSINLITGQLKTNAVLNYEVKKVYEVSVTVNDGSSTDSIGVTINVMDVNEAPVFEEDTVTHTIEENTAVNTNIGTVITATDPDGDELAYTLDGDDAESFDIDENSGQLKTKSALDFETKQVYRVLIIASDDELEDSLKVTINITDVDENRAPIFEDGSATTRSIAENTGSGVDIGAPVSASDADNDSLTYTLGGTDAASFEINSTNGQLRTKGALDYETKRTYSVTVTASDGKLSDSITVTINVTDVDENNAPVFASANTTRSVAENTGSGVNIGNAVSATDPDNDDLTYTLGGTDAASFEINSTNGQLRTKDALDYETKRTYSVTVTASDGKLSDSITVTINVTDVDENRSPVFASASTTRSVAENTGSGVNIGNAVSATDPDGDDLTYTLDGTDASAFNIVSSSGQLKTKAALNYENKDSYSVTVTASDGKLTDSITVTISVTDVDENRPPVFTEGQSTTRSIAENTDSGTNIGSPISATDADNDTLTYTLGGTDASSFDIASTSGQLQTKVSLDFETKDSYSVTVSVADAKGGTDSINVTINITDDTTENHFPEFSEGSSTTRSIAENTDSGTNIGSPVAATDANNDTLTYSIGGTDAASFSLVSTTGQLKTVAPLNYETKSSYSLIISVNDSRGGSDTITVTINITNVHPEISEQGGVNNAPVFDDGPSTTRSILEGTTSGTNIGSAITATDSDSSDTLTYTLSGTGANSFTIVSTTGQLKTSAALVYDTKSSYSVTVTVYDGEGGTDTISVTINVLDEDANNPPVFDDGETTTRSVDEGLNRKSKVGSPVSATDADSDTLTYSIVTDGAKGTGSAGTNVSIDNITAWFTIDNNGQIKTNSPIGYETWHSYTFTVKVTDGNDGSDTIIVTVNVRNINTARPSFTEGDSTTRSIPENTAANVNVGAPVTATDADNTKLTYTKREIYPGLIKPPDSFSIDEDTGQLKTKLPLNYESVTSYRIFVIVWDSDPESPGVHTDRIIVTVNITDVNDPPVISQGSQRSTSVDDGKAANSNVSSRFLATDEDGDNITWSLDGTDKDSFSINEGTGQITTKIAMDYDTKNSYSVNVVASDGNGGTDTLRLTIRVNPPETDPVVPPVVSIENPLLVDRTTEVAKEIIRKFDKSESEITASDLAGISSLRVRGTDLTTLKEDDFDGLSGLRDLFLGSNELTSLPDGIFDGLSNLRYIELSSNDLTSLSSDVFDGLSKLESLELYNNANLSSLPADIFDGLSSLSYLELSHIGLNNSLPNGIFEGLSMLDTFDLTGNGPVGDIGYFLIPVILVKDGTGVKVTIPIGAPFDVSIPITVVNGTLNGDVTSITVSAGSVNSSTVGVTRTTGTTAPVTVNTGEFPSIPEDHDGYMFVNGLESAVVIIPQDANNDAPVFSDGASTTRLIAENTAADVTIGTPIAATDANDDTLTYTLSGTDAASFSIVSTSGQLKTKSALDFETKTSYSIIVSVADGEGGTDSISVTINVTDITVNNPPTFTEGTSTTRTVPENTSAGSNIGTAVVATDVDADTLTYTLTGTDSSSFAIVSTSGQLQTSASLDYEEKKSYMVTVNAIAANEGGNASIDVTINITNVVEDTLLVNRTSKVKELLINAANVESADSITPEKLAQITVLNWNDKRISSLKEGDFDGLSSVESVYLNRNILTSLPNDVFKGLSSATAIYISFNEISSISDDAFNGLSTLETLHLNDNELSIDSAIFDGLTALETLNLSDNPLSSLDENLFEDLTSLMSLNIELCDLTSLPSDIFEGLTSLTDLDISGNNLTSLPSDIFEGLTSLTDLDISNISLTSLPSNIFEGLSSLEDIYLYANNLTSLPDGLFDGLTSLITFGAKYSNTNPLTITVSLELDGNGVKVKIPVGAPKDVDIPVNVTNGSLNDNVTTIRVTKGSVESESVTVTRTAGTTGAVTANIGSLPNIASSKLSGIALVKPSTGLPLTVIAAVPAGPIVDSDVIPNSTALFSNFPNPFNPETWIPYQLAKPADVSLRIYNIRGVVVREITLGQQPAGYYATQSRAIHWDGRNAVGEKVASGVYFYMLTADDYRALRSMLIVK